MVCALLTNVLFVSRFWSCTLKVEWSKKFLQHLHVQKQKQSVKFSRALKIRQTSRRSPKGCEGSLESSNFKPGLPSIISLNFIYNYTLNYAWRINWYLKNKSSRKLAKLKTTNEHAFVCCAAFTLLFTLFLRLRDLLMSRIHYLVLKHWTQIKVSKTKKR